MITRGVPNKNEGLLRAIEDSRPYNMKFGSTGKSSSVNVDVGSIPRLAQVGSSSIDIDDDDNSDVDFPGGCNKTRTQYKSVKEGMRAQVTRKLIEALVSPPQQKQCNDGRADKRYSI